MGPEQREAALRAYRQHAEPAAATNAPEASFFRLPEWFVVETAKQFADFMDHDVWALFPFLSTAGMYWWLLWQTVRSLVRDRGWRVLLTGQSLKGLAMDYVFSNSELERILF